MEGRGTGTVSARCWPLDNTAYSCGCPRCVRARRHGPRVQYAALQGGHTRATPPGLDGRPGSSKPPQQEVTSLGPDHTSIPSH